MKPRAKPHAANRAAAGGAVDGHSLATIRLMDFNFSTDEQHRATLEVLRETLDYLERLPKVPVTRELCARVQAHLDDPTHRLVARVHRELHGSAVTSAGLPLLDACVKENVLTLQLPHLPDGKARVALNEMVRALTSGPGLHVGLRPRNGHPAE
jgi:hypothetical protein